MKNSPAESETQMTSTDAEKGGASGGGMSYKRKYEVFSQWMPFAETKVIFDPFKQ